MRKIETSLSLSSHLEVSYFMQIIHKKDWLSSSYLDTTKRIQMVEAAILTTQKNTWTEEFLPKLQV